MSEENKSISLKYHEHNPVEIDEILTPDFVGHGNGTENTWDRESHRRGWTEYYGKVEDTVREQIAGGDWVATRFTRSGTYQGKPMLGEFMQLKRFEGGRIAEIWEVC